MVFYFTSGLGRKRENWRNEIFKLRYDMNNYKLSRMTKLVAINMDINSFLK